MLGLAIKFMFQELYNNDHHTKIPEKRENKERTATLVCLTTLEYSAIDPRTATWLDLELNYTLCQQGGCGLMEHAPL